METRTEARVFDSVVSNLRKTYPRNKMQDISTSFCFICLLHLANERGLKIEVGESLGAEGEGQPEEGNNKVGDLWGLRVVFSRPFHLVVQELIVIFIPGLQGPKRRSLGVMGGYRRINALSLYTQMHLRVFYHFFHFFILPIILFSPSLSDICLRTVL